jgi:polygalacturonase
MYNHRNNWYGNSSDITVENSALWADVAHPINIGTHGNPLDPETLSNIVIRNIDILDHREMQVDYQGCIAINVGDANVAENIWIEDVRVENIRLGQLLNMRVMYNQKYNTAPGGGIRNVTITDFVYNGNRAAPSTIVGYDDARGIELVTFRNLTINGKAIFDKMKKPSWYLTSDFVPAFTNEHVRNLTFV